jgi:hypothetical protein
MEDFRGNAHHITFLEGISYRDIDITGGPVYEVPSKKNENSDDKKHSQQKSFRPVL